VHYFVSYYDYYQPEAFVVKTGTYIEKESTINEEIDRLRHAATESLLTRRDVIIVASVSCIYGIGEVDDYHGQTVFFETKKNYPMESIISTLVSLQFRRASADFKPGMFRLIGDVLEIFPSSSEHILVLDFFGDELERMYWKEALTNERIETVSEVTLFPAKHFVTSPDIVAEIIPKIRTELDERIEFFKKNGKLLEAERIKMKTEYDLEMLQEV
jgi:excinuclease ABC subunit B